MLTPILQILRTLNDKTFISAACIADQLGFSQAEVNHALQRSEAYGVTLISQVGIGYRLSQPIDWLDENRVRPLLGKLISYYSLTTALSVDSTNKILKADHCAPDGQVMAAEWQTQGKGRLGRAWEGIVGGSLMFSVKKVFLQDVSRLSGLSLAVGIAILRSLQQAGVRGAYVKWPNDIVCQAGKLGGILIEVSDETLESSTLIIGIGLNYQLPDKLKETQGYADCQALGLTQDRNTLWATILTHLYTVLNQFEQEGLTPFIVEWERAHIWQNQQVEIIRPEPQQRVVGKAIGITSNGAIRMEIAGQEHIFFSGDISLRKPA